jgi:hypothetical protein
LRLRRPPTSQKFRFGATPVIENFELNLRKGKLLPHSGDEKTSWQKSDAPTVEPPPPKSDLKQTVAWQTSQEPLH